VARCLIIGCGCRGRSLAHELGVRGYAVRGTTRDPRRSARIDAAGVEAIVADPDRVATIAPALEQATVVYLLLGSAVGQPQHLMALHGTRLEMLLHRTVDTSVRGIVYEAAGAVDPAVLGAGAELVRTFCERSRIGYALLDVEPGEHKAWLAAALEAVERALVPR
jgi:predicted dinucleotide-binding enzyme